MCLLSYSQASVTLDGRSYNVGGVLESMPRAYLNRTDLKSQLRPDPESFQYWAHKTGPIQARYPYTPGRRGAPKDFLWPPKGVHLQIQFNPPVDYLAREEHRGYFCRIRFLYLTETQLSNISLPQLCSIFLSVFKKNNSNPSTMLCIRTVLFYSVGSIAQNIKK